MVKISLNKGAILIISMMLLIAVTGISVATFSIIKSEKAISRNMARVAEAESAVLTAMSYAEKWLRGNFIPANLLGTVGTNPFPMPSSAECQDINDGIHCDIWDQDFNTLPSDERDAYDTDLNWWLKYGVNVPIANQNNMRFVLEAKQRGVTTGGTNIYDIRIIAMATDKTGSVMKRINKIVRVN